MSDYSVYAIGASQVSVSGGQQLSGITQGDGSHLVTQTITLNSAAFQEILITDGGADTSFGDSDGDQRLHGAQSFDGTGYADNLRVEAEYRLTLTDPEGNTYEAIAFNINAADGLPSYGSVEGLAFLGGPGGFPPAGVPLTVTAAFEGPNYAVADYATPICFAEGTLIRTPRGDVPVESLSPGDAVLTYDTGAQSLRWIGQSRLGRRHLARRPEHRPVVIRKHALGAAGPNRDLRLSPQHRILIRDWRAQLYFGETEILVPARSLVNDTTIRTDRACTAVTYYHILLDGHALVWSDGLLTESLLPPGALRQLGRQTAYDEATALFPDLADHALFSARMCPDGRETRLLSMPPT